MSIMIGHVTEERYTELVAHDRELVATMTRCQFTIGDHALEIEPLQNHGGSHAGEEAFSVESSLQRYAEDISIPYHSVKKYRWVSARWPVQQRQQGVSHGVHRILADIPDEARRFTVITEPPLNRRTGRHEWTLDAARREVGEQVHHPVSVQEKVQAVHDLARDEDVAARVATDLLRRPDVAFQAMGDSTARHLVNRAQEHRSRQSGETARRQAEPALRRMERDLGFVDLIGACAAFVSAVGRVVPTLRGHEFSEDERAIIGKNVARVRSTADWIETAVDSGSVSMDEGLARLLRGE